jgi:hypothetical protein
MTIDKFSEDASPTLNASYAGEDPPSFGHQLLEHFCFAPGYVNLNSGLS